MTGRILIGVSLMALAVAIRGLALAAPLIAYARATLATTEAPMKR